MVGYRCSLAAAPDALFHGFQVLIADIYVMPLPTTFARRVLLAIASVILLACGSVTIPVAGDDQPTTLESPTVAPNSAATPLVPEGPAQDVTITQPFDTANYLHW